MMDVLMGLVVGLGLSAACGFRVFVPLLGMSIANMAGHLQLAAGFEWIGSWPALIVFATATVLEIGGYFIPWLDNLLDAAATPAAVVAGTIVTASQVGEMSPLLQWSLAAIAGGGASVLVQSGTVAIRAASATATAGVGNILVSTAEMFASVLFTVLAIVLPIVGLLTLVVVAFLIFRRINQPATLADPPATPT